VAASCNTVLGNERATLDEDAATPDGTSPPPPPPADDASQGPSLDAAACAAGEKTCNGACVPLTDPLFGCGVEGCAPCALARATAACTGDGTCVVAACQAGYADCDKDPANGCEIDLAQPSHCGACNAACAAAAPVCVPTTAGFACATGCTPQAPTRCGDQCVDLASSPTHCGSCNDVCAPVANGQVSCARGACAFSCTAGFHACGGACADSTSPASCGAACSPCPAGPNATATCRGGACGLSCAGDFADCNGSAADGCEVNLASDPKNCGACARACAPGLRCVNRACTGAADAAVESG
jgi:hypothetical protein